MEKDIKNLITSVDALTKTTNELTKSVDIISFESAVVNVSVEPMHAHLLPI